MQLLIEYGADVNAVDRDGTTPLHIAANREDKQSIVLCLLENGANAHCLERTAKKRKAVKPIDLTMRSCIRQMLEEEGTFLDT